MGWLWHVSTANCNCTFDTDANRNYDAVGDNVDCIAKKIVVPERVQIWIEVRKRYHLSDAQIQMARELGLNPHKFGKISNEKQEPWKIPLPQFIEAIYFKRFHKSQPDLVQSLEEMIQAQQVKKAEKKARKAELKDKSTSSDADASSTEKAKL